MSRILIVAGNSDFRSSLRSLFESDPDFTVCAVAGETAEAIKKAQTLQPGLIILDESLPLMNGYEAAQALKSVLPRIPLFLLVDQHNYEAEAEALSRGADAVFTKGEDLTPLLSNARLVCSKEQSEKGGTGNDGVAI